MKNLVRNWDEVGATWLDGKQVTERVYDMEIRRRHREYVEKNRREMKEYTAAEMFNLNR